ncbi:MAG: UDP-N-acetylmuramate dehydrogenase [Candidatus Babeliaceae bacterium]|nr:UDP-N-acetylmuramate dehydrogenase [Candidatus Babeliaceae bacterium]
MFSSLITENVSLADKNWFRTGGAARFFAEPTSVAEFQQVLSFVRNSDLSVFVLGLGANLLINDTGFDGIVIRSQIKDISIIPSEDEQCELVKAGAGVTIDDLIAFCLERQLIGLEELSGIPGTVGGSVYINVHYYSHMLSDFLVSAQVIEVATGEICDVDASWFDFGYDFSTLHYKRYLLISATFKVKKATALETAYAQGRSFEIIRHRRQRYPAQGTCGSFFRNFHEDEVTVESNGRKMIFVAYYLDKLGIKGELSFGGAVVSYQHANMIVNRGNATSRDIVNLARAMQELVRDAFGIVPQPECQFLGFEKNPLL